MQAPATAAIGFHAVRVVLSTDAVVKSAQTVARGEYGRYPTQTCPAPRPPREAQEHRT